MTEIPWLKTARLWMITDVAAARGRKISSLVQEGIAGGVDVVVARFKGAEREFLIEQAELIAGVCRSKGVPWILSHEIDLFTQLKPDGIHLSSADLPVAQAKELIGDSVAIGYSAHSVEDIEQAAISGANYCWFSPVFATKKHGVMLLGVGLAVSRLAVEKSIRIGTNDEPFPIVFLGGITPNNVSALTKIGAKRIAAIGSLIGAEDVRAAAENLKTELSRNG